MASQDICACGLHGIKASSRQTFGSSLIAGGLFSPLDHSSGAFGLLKSLLQGSLPAPQRPPVPIIPRPPAAQQQHAMAPTVPVQQEQENAVPQPHKHTTSGAAANGGDARLTSATQFGGRLQRLRLPDYTGGGKTTTVAADTAAPGIQRTSGGGKAGAAFARDSGRQPLAARQLPESDSRSSGKGGNKAEARLL
jgi:hypothetical protein